MRVGFVLCKVKIQLLMSSRIWDWLSFFAVLPILKMLFFVAIYWAYSYEVIIASAHPIKPINNDDVPSCPSVWRQSPFSAMHYFCSRSDVDALLKTSLIHIASVETILKSFSRCFICKCKFWFLYKFFQVQISFRKLGCFSIFAMKQSIFLFLWIWGQKFII